MIGGQVLIAFVGGEAFKITPLDGKEWGLSIGLGAISLPWGAFIRLVPDAWLGACLPWFIRKKWAPETIDERVQAGHRARKEDDVEPLRALTGLRGRRVTANIHRGFGEYVHDQKNKVEDKVAKAYQQAGGSATEVLLVGARVANKAMPGSSNN